MRGTNEDIQSLLTLKFRVKRQKPFVSCCFQEPLIGTHQDEIIADAAQLVCRAQRALQDNFISTVDRMRINQLPVRDNLLCSW